jgi:hypothetical protein
MNLLQIKNATIGYADRYDDEVANTFLLWVPVVEGRINSVLTTRLSLKDAVIPITTTNQTFAFPVDVLFLKQVKLVETSGTEVVFQYISEAYLNKIIANGVSKPYYTVTNNAVQLAYQVKDDGAQELHLRYEQQLPALVDIADTNWLSISSPQVYIFGLLVELYAFVKDAEAAAAWDARFQKELDNIENTDYRTQWSGTTPLQQKLG